MEVAHPSETMINTHQSARRHIAGDSILHVGSEVLGEVAMKTSIFCDITPGSPLKVGLRF
jgi:hypothetical protein